MAGPCPAPAFGGSMVTGLIDFVDCQSQLLGTLGYRALATPGSSVMLATTALLVIFVALFGYRMILGETPDLRAAVIALVRMGVVMMLGTSWAAYSVLVYDVAVHVPVDIASALGRAIDLPGMNGDLVAAIQDMDNQLDRLRASGVAPRLTFLISTLGALLALRIVAGLLLAVGPLFMAFLLFDTTRGLLEGWARVLIGTAIAMVGTLLVLGIELTVLMPATAEMLAAEKALAPPPHGPLYLLLLMAPFVIALLGGIIASYRVAAGFKLRPAYTAPPNRADAPRMKTNVAAQDSAIEANVAPSNQSSEPASRAANIAASINAAERRQSKRDLPEAPLDSVKSAGVGKATTATEIPARAGERGRAPRRSATRWRT